MTALAFCLAGCWTHPLFQDQLGVDPATDSDAAILALAASSNDGGQSVTQTDNSGRSYRYIFVTDASYQGGAVSGKSGADAKCMSDANYPGSGTYKALLGVKNQRHWCRSDFGSCPGGAAMDWVLSANTEYRRSDESAVISTTDGDGRFSSALSSTWSTYTDDAWTGLAPDYSSSNATSECGFFTGFGCCGNHITLTNTTTFNEGNLNCSNPARLICVEQ